MALSLIDVDLIDDEDDVRRDLVRTMVKHRVVTTALPGIWKTYSGSIVIGSTFMAFTSLVVAVHGVRGLWCLLALFFPGMTTWADWASREGRRFISGRHAACHERITGETSQLLHQVRSFNTAVRALERLTHIPTALREDSERRLTARRVELMAWHERLCAEFETAFGPCIAELETRKLYSRNARLETEHRQQLIALAEAVDDRSLKNELLDLEPTMAALPALHDPLVTTEEKFDELERLHGHEVPHDTP